MERSAAEALMATLSRIGEALNEANRIVSEHSTSPEKEHLRRGLGTMMDGLWVDLMWPIARQYPHLDPDKDSDWFRDLQARRKSRGEGVNDA